MQFGTSGLRGLVTEMTDDVCAAHAAAFLRHLRRSGFSVESVLVGEDLRPSSPRIAAACRRAVRAEGAAAVACGVVPTPALALESARRGVPAIMVTGSHIPFDRNGLKFYRPDGEITKADEAGLLAALDAPAPPPLAPGAEEPGTGVSERYVARYVDFFGPGRLAGKRIGLYAHSAAGRDLTAETLSRLGAEVVELGRTDDFVPIDTEAISPEDATRIAGWIAEHRLDALVSTDGDGDRSLIADETGAVLRGDSVGTLTAKALGADAVATPINASTALERSGWIPRIRRTRIGSPYVIEGIEALAAEGARLPVGYEANGGFLLAGAATGRDGRTLAPLPTRDAMLPLLALLVGAADAGLTLSAFAARLPTRVTASDRLPEIPQELSAPLLQALASDAAARASLLDGIGEVAGIDLTDGVRMTLVSGDIVHPRMSGNAPELRCYAEAAEAGRARELVALVLTRIGARLGSSR